jgi:hypothetical protein
VRIPYYGPNGEELAVRFRIGLDGDRFRWKSGTKPCLYGLHRLAMVQAAGYVVLVEGESTATRYGPTASRPLAFRELPIGVRIAMRGISMISRQSTSSWSPIAVATPFKSGCRVQVSGIGRS